MMIEITHWEGDSSWKEIIRANNLEDIRKIASARNPNSKIVASNTVA